MTADTVGGVWTYAIELARALEGRGAEVALATMGERPSPDQRAEVRALPGVELFESTYRLEWMDEPWDDVARAGEWLLDLAARLAPDVVHLNGYAHGALPWPAPVLAVGHSCVLSWWRAVKGADAPPEWARYRDAVRRGLRAADLVVAPTRAMLRALHRHYGPLPRARVIPNGRDPARFAPADKDAFVLTVGRLWDEAKNVAAVDRVAPELTWPVYVAGEERHPSGRTSRFDGAHALGKLAAGELTSWYARAAVYALPARYEPFGLSALEAGLSGCALVLGDIPSLREVWGDAALFVHPERPAELRDALGGLIRDAARRRELGARARERALEYTAASMASAYLDAYGHLRHGVTACAS